MTARVLRLALNDLRLTWKDRTSMVWMLLMPVLFVLFFGYIGSRGNQGPSDRSIRLTVVDRDVSWLSRALLDSLKAEDFDVHEVGEAEAVSLADRTRTLVIPEGFADAVARKKQVTLFLARQEGASDRGTAVAELHVHRALVQLIGTLVDMELVATPAEPLDLQADHLQDFRRHAQRESLVKIETSYAGAGRPVPQGFGQAVPGMLAQFMVMAVLIGGSTSLTEDKASGVLRRLAVAPFTPRSLIAGRLVGLLALGVVQALVLLVLGWAVDALNLFGTQFYWGPSPIGLALVILASAASTASIGLFLGAVLSTPAQASAVGWLAGMIMAGLGGCWWPLEVVPGWLRQAGHVFPTAWTMDALHDLTSFGKGLDAVLPEVGILLAIATVFGVLGSKLLKVQG